MCDLKAQAALQADVQTIRLPNGDNGWIFAGLDKNREEATFVVTQSATRAMELRGLATKLAQFRNIVVPTLITARHMFRGLKRPLCAGQDMNADQKKVIYSWKPAIDWTWRHSERFGLPKLRDAPKGKVFVVIATPNIEQARSSGVDYWAESWSWLRESPTRPEAPVDWEKRYAERIWSHDDER